MTSSDELRCPVCSARVRGETSCGRCQADLTEYLTLLAAAWRSRKAGWQALLAGDFQTAATLASRSRSLLESESARRLTALAQCLAARDASP
ncbi:MAG: hypothetical protein AB7I19_19025 [Planctomycetota bacterium]